MKKPRRVLFLVYDGFELIDLSGPASVFAMANTLSGTEAYETMAVSLTGGLVRSASGLAVQSAAVADLKISGRDSVLAMGAESPALRRAMAEIRHGEWLNKAAKTAERYGSVCSGAFLLAAAGLLDGRRAATHWAACQPLSRFYPAIRLDPEALYVVDGRLWTSAGGTTGIDMALAILKQDCGAALMGEVAKRLVVYAHRPGNQSQFSTLLAAQTAAGGALSAVVPWIETKLDRPLKVEDMARQAGMSERNFYRKFTRAIGMTPAKFLEMTRLETAKRLLESGQPVKAVAGAVGFRSENGFRAAFQHRFGLSPSMHRQIHAAQTGGAKLVDTGLRLQSRNRG